MLIRRIMENDTRNCYEAMTTDTQLAELDKAFYRLADAMPNKDKMELESVFSGYMARVIRIAYLQGLKDFQEMHVILKEDSVEILKNYIDCSKRQ